MNQSTTHPHFSEPPVATVAETSTHPSELTRRQYLGALTAAAATTLAMPAPRALGNDQLQAPESTADACILLWMGGGMAAPDNFDPKRYLPFEVGTPVEKIISTFPAIDTKVDNIKICQGLERIADVMDRATMIRSHVLPDLGHILHSRHQYHWHTGYVPPQTVAAPHIGAWIAHQLGARNPVMPAFFNIGQRIEGNGESQELKAFTTGGFLGNEYGPFNLPYPEKATEAVRPPSGMNKERFSRRYKALKRLLKEDPRAEYASDFHQESMLRALNGAHRLLSSKERTAFDLTLEKKERFNIYNTGRFGRGCLLARRLVEGGARFVEVTTEYVPFLHWDTHQDGHRTVDRLHKEIDRPIAQLVLDLEERGMLDRTLVIIASEFSRDMMIEGVPGSSARDQSQARTDVLKEVKHYGLHRHFTGASSVLLFGGGMKRGFLYGRSADERPCVAVENPVGVPDLHATVLTAMGIHPRTSVDIERRPFYVTKDGTGKAVRDVFA